MMMEIIMPSTEITSLTPYQSCFVLGDSNGDAAAAEELDLPFIMTP